MFAEDLIGYIPYFNLLFLTCIPYLCGRMQSLSFRSLRLPGAVRSAFIKYTRRCELQRRGFASTQAWCIATADMSAEDVAGLKVQQDRLMNDIHYTCEWGKGEAWGRYVSIFFCEDACWQIPTYSIPNNRVIDNSCYQLLTCSLSSSAPTEVGMSRLSLSDADKQARDWFEETVKSLGCTVTVDQMGNQFAVRPGLKDGPPTYAGSHLDTQPTV